MGTDLISVDGNANVPPQRTADMVHLSMAGTPASRNAAQDAFITDILQSAGGAAMLIRCIDEYQNFVSFWERLVLLGASTASTASTRDSTSSTSSASTTSTTTKYY